MLKAGSWDAMRDVFALVAESGLPAPPRHVALIVAKHMGVDGVCDVSTSTIADESGYGSTAVYEAIQRLTPKDDNIEAANKNPEKVFFSLNKKGERVVDRCSIFFRVVGGARVGDRYSSSTWSLLDHVKGYGTREARLARGSLSGVEGSVRRCRGVRQVVTKDQRITTSRPETLSRERDGTPVDAIPCPSCGVAGYLTQSPARGAFPPGWWCRREKDRRGPGCGENLPLDDPEILPQLTPAKRRSVEAAIKTMTMAKPDRLTSKPSKEDAVEAAAAEVIRRYDERGGFFPKSRPEVSDETR